METRRSPPVEKLNQHPWSTRDSESIHTTNSSIMSSTTHEDLAAKLLAAEELVKTLQAQLAKTSELLNEYIEQFYGIKRDCCCHAAGEYSAPEDSDED
jgi:hypothetical protein